MLHSWFQPGYLRRGEWVQCGKRDESTCRLHKEFHFDWTKATVPTNMKLRLTTWLGVENEQTAKLHPDRISQVLSYLSRQKDHSCFFIYFAGSLVENCSFHNINYASYGIQSCNLCKKISCKGCRRSLGGQSWRHPAVATLHQPRCLVLVWAAALPFYMQQTRQHHQPEHVL